MTTLHLMVGLPCSGKTTYGKKLAEDEGALLLSPDEWQIKLFEQKVYDPDSDHDLLHDRIESLMLSVTERLLAIGCSVVLDFGFWSRGERDALRALAERLGVCFKLHYMDTPMEEMKRRVVIRNREAGDGVIVIDPKFLDIWSQSFEPPGEEELY